MVDSITGARANASTDVQLARDDKNLYLFYRAVERGQESHLHECTRNGDRSIYQNDAVEMFLQAQGPGSGYFQVTVSPTGASFTSRRDTSGNPLPWKPTGIEAAGHLDFDYWNVEFKIPFADLGVATPAAGTTWRANFCRNELPGQRHWNAWSSTGGDFHQPERFGVLKFTDTASTDSPTLRGTVVDGSGNPIANVPVKGFGRIERSNTMGRFTFTESAKHLDAADYDERRAKMFDLIEKLNQR